jgi:trimeric autotransporter adhesin
VDNAGNVILANTITTPVTPTVVSPWTINGNDVINSNTGRVSINNGLSTKNGLIVESGNFVLSQIKLTSVASKSTGKVLSVDDNGNVILVKDSVGTATGTPPTATPSPWAITGNNIANSNTGSVYVNNGLVLSKLSSNAVPTVTSQKVLSVDVDGNVILVNTPAATAPVTTTELWKANTTGGIFNNSTYGITVTSSEDGKSGLNFAKLKASSTPGNSYGKVLTVDDNGNVILVNDAVGGASTPAGWNIVDGRVQNTNNGKVVIGTGINSFPDGRWADYVFKKDYKLMSLKDVEKFINHNQHLPNVPSAEEMAKNGLDVMETSAKFMEKLEELTLYMIDANKKIEALEAKVKSLEKGQK